MTLDEILEPIKILQIEFENHFEAMLDSEIKLIKDVLSYLNHSKGKRLRPSVMLLVAAAILAENNSLENNSLENNLSLEKKLSLENNLSEENSLSENISVPERIYKNATIIELLHTATLVHDDVVDNSTERRGQVSVNAVWNNKTSVLIGDYLFAHAMRPALHNKDYDFLTILSEATAIMTEGELLAIQQSQTLDFTEELYYKIIFAKTASLLSAACYVSANVCSKSDNVKEALKEYGKNIGMAFQMRDDIFDYVSNSAIIGKPVGNDLKEKKLTLPMIYALSKASEQKRIDILNLIKTDYLSKNNLSKLINFAVDSGGIDYATNKAGEFVCKAINSLAILKDSVAKNSLIEFAKFVVTREK